jgi:hypothetical protein
LVLYFYIQLSRKTRDEHERYVAILWMIAGVAALVALVGLALFKRIPDVAFAMVMIAFSTLGIFAIIVMLNLVAQQQSGGADLSDESTILPLQVVHEWLGGRGEETDHAWSTQRGKWALFVLILALGSLALPAVHSRPWAVAVAVLVCIPALLFIFLVLLEEDVRSGRLKRRY